MPKGDALSLMQVDERRSRPFRGREDTRRRCRGVARAPAGKPLARLFALFLIRRALGCRAGALATPQLNPSVHKPVDGVKSLVHLSIRESALPLGTHRIRALLTLRTSRRAVLSAVPVSEKEKTKGFAIILYLAVDESPVCIKQRDCFHGHGHGSCRCWSL